VVNDDHNNQTYYDDESRLDGRSINTDFLILLGISYEESDSLAMSIQCRYNLNSLFRPVVGEMIVFRTEIRNYISSKKVGDSEYQFESMISTIIHEIFHLLGFSEDMY